MELGQVEDVDTRLRVEAYMMWPENEKAREFYLARNLALHLAIWPEVVANNPKRAKLFEECGAEYRELLIGALSRVGHTALRDETYANEAYPEPLSDPVKRKRMTTAGFLLMLTRALDFQSQSLPGGASLLKSVFILSNNNNIEDTRVIYNNRKEIFESWKIYKKTCHLIIARLILRYVMIYEDHEYYTHSWLAIARDYQNFLLNFMPLHGKKQPILTRDELWMVPSALDLADFSVPQWTLPSAVMDIVKRYRAPISH